METIVRIYKPGLPINLYDSAKHKFCHGVIVINSLYKTTPPGETNGGLVYPTNSLLEVSFQAAEKVGVYLNKVKQIAEKSFFIIGKLRNRLRNYQPVKQTFAQVEGLIPVPALPVNIPIYKYFIVGTAIGLLFTSVFLITTTVLPIAGAVADALMIYSKPRTELFNEANHSSNKESTKSYSGNFIIPEGANHKNEFKISIPKINLESEVIANVDSTNESSYKEELQKGVAHANGSYFPGEEGPVFLFAHSTDTIFNIEQYNAKFFALKDTEVGDEIKISFKGKQYLYKINHKEIINPGDIDRLRDSKADLILSTCFPPGTNWQRLIVYADAYATPN